MDDDAIFPAHHVELGDSDDATMESREAFDSKMQQMFRLQTLCRQNVCMQLYTSTVFSLNCTI